MRETNLFRVSPCQRHSEISHAHCRVYFAGRKNLGAKDLAGALTNVYGASRGRLAAARFAYNACRSLSRRAFAVCQKVSNSRRKLFNPCAGQNDAVTPAVCLLSDPQESSALVFPEFDVEALAFNPQFSRLDNVIHFS